MTEDQERKNGGWHLDKKVPIAIITAILFQTGVAIWFASSLSKTVDQHEAKISKIETIQQKQNDKSNEITGRLIRLEERTVTILDAVKDIKDGLVQQRRPPQP